MPRTLYADPSGPAPPAPVNFYGPPEPLGPPAPPQVVDNQLWLQQQQQANAQWAAAEQQRIAEEQERERQRLYGARQMLGPPAPLTPQAQQALPGALQQGFAGIADADTIYGAGSLLAAEQQASEGRRAMFGENGDAIRQQQLDEFRNVRVDDFSSYEEAEAEAVRRSKMISGVRLIEREQTTPGDMLNYQPPGFVAAQQAIGSGARKVGEATRIPGAGAVAEFAAETAIPTHLWEIELALIPGIGEVPGSISKVGDLVRAAKAGLPEAKALLPEVARALSSEEGALRFGRKAGDEVTPGEVRQAFKPTGSKVAAGTRVFASDRNNFGRVIATQGDTATVYFKNATGAEATVDVAIDTLHPITSGGRRVGTKVVPLSSDELAQAWEVLPAENQKLIGTVATNTMPDVERNAIIASSRGAKSRTIQEIMEGSGSAEEKLAQAWVARRGADAPTQQPLRSFFEDTEIASYKRQIVDAAVNGVVTGQEATNAGSILNLLMDGARSDGTQRLISAGERSLMGKIFGPELMKVLPTTPQKMGIWQKLMAPFQLWRSAKTAFDVGAMFRQGRKVIFSDPKEWLRSSRTQFRALGQKGYERVQEIVHNSPFYSIGQSAERPLGILEQGEGLSDEFLSPLTKPATGTGIVTRVKNAALEPLRVSERVYNAFLNTLRQSIFDKNMEDLIRQAGGDLNKVPQGEIQRIIDNINTATMFGNISKLGDWSKVMSQTLFSVRSLVSQPQFYADFVRASGPAASPAARKIIYKRFASAIASDLAILGSMAYLGAYLKEQGSPTEVKVDLDPFSQTLGDVRIGPAKWNPWGPEAQMVRAAIQAGWGKQRKEGASELTDINAFDRAKGFGRTKLSPFASVVYDLFLNDQRDFQGRPIKDRVMQYAAEQASPIMGFAMWEAFHDKGAWGAAELAQAVGADVQVYGASKTTQKKEATKTEVESLTEGGIPFSGNEIDFSRPILDGGQNRQELEQFTEFDTGDKSLSEVREQFVETYWQQKADAFNLSEPRARAAVGDDFDAEVKPMTDQAEKNMKAYWEAHPQDLKAALDAGETGPAKYKDEILQEAGIE